jgi:hypothetical protein
MEAITVSFERQLVNLRRAVRKDRDQLRKIGNQEIVRFVNYEHKLNDMVTAVLPTNVALQQVAKGAICQSLRMIKRWWRICVAITLRWWSQPGRS